MQASPPAPALPPPAPLPPPGPAPPLARVSSLPLRRRRYNVLVLPERAGAGLKGEPGRASDLPAFRAMTGSSYSSNREEIYTPSPEYSYYTANPKYSPSFKVRSRKAKYKPLPELSPQLRNEVGPKYSDALNLQPGLQGSAYVSHSPTPPYTTRLRPTPPHPTSHRVSHGADPPRSVPTSYSFSYRVKGSKGGPSYTQQEVKLK